MAHVHLRPYPRRYLAAVLAAGLFATATASAATISELPGETAPDGDVESEIVYEDDPMASAGQHHPAPEDTRTHPLFMLLSGAEYEWSQAISNAFGNTRFGAGYTLRHVLKIVDAKLNSDVQADVFVNLFGSSKALAQFNYHLAGEKNKKDKFFQVKILGDEVFSDSKLNDTSTTTAYKATKTFFKAKHTFAVGPIPVVVSVKVKGSLGLGASALVKDAEVSLIARPSAGLYGKATAAAGIDGIFTIGMTGKVNFLSLKPEFYHVLRDKPREGHFVRTRANLAITTLDGVLEIFAKAGYSFLSVEYRRKILDWEGLSFFKALYQETEDTEGSNDLEPFGDLKF